MKGKTVLALVMCLLLVASFAFPFFVTESERGGMFVVASAEEDDGEGNQGGEGGGEEQHTHSWTKTGSVEPTCSQEGYVDYKCEGCGETKKETISKLAHTWTEAENVKSTCSQEGYVLYKCESCGETKTETLSKLAHTWKVKENVKATCSKEGYVVTECEVCGETKTETLSKLDHTYDNACDPDCNVCHATRETSHVPNKVWSKDAGGHWHICTVCGGKADEGDHYPGPAATEEKDQICLTCGYILTRKLSHVHKFETEYTSDETGHWYACEDCGEKKDFEQHTYENPCDAKCSTCGFERDNAHSYGDTFQYDEEYHWCVCTLCGNEGDHVLHVPGDAATADQGQTCLVCGKELAPPLNHVHEVESWSYDEQSHEGTCACGMTMEEGPHTWDGGVENPDGTTTFTCGLCGAERLEGEPKAAEAQFPWVLVLGIGALTLAIGAAVALVVVLTKKPSGKFSK